MTPQVTRTLIGAIRLSVVIALCVVVPVFAVSAEAIDRRPVDIELFDVRSVVPADWQDLGTGTFTRGTPPDDPTVIVLQSAAASVAEIWPMLLPQLARTDIPEATGSRSTGAFDWTLYAMDVELPDLTVAIELALAEEGGRTFLVLMQSDADESDVLREQVFLPALDEFRELEPEPTPDPATLGYSVEEVAFDGGSDDLRLAGTLTLPPGPGPHPVVILLTGSGPQDRDESLKPATTLKPFAVIADALTRAGVGVLRYDDRGVGGSTGDYEAATVTDLTADARAALDYVVSREDVDADRIGILGHSEGGLYAATLAADDRRVAFVVAMAPPAVDGVSLLAAQREAIARSSGQPDEEIEATMALSEKLLPLVLAGDEDGARAVLDDAIGAFWDRQADDVRAVLGDRDAFVELQLEAQLPTYTSDWFRSFLASDPATDWSRVAIPALGLFGALDVQVPLEQNEPAWTAALVAARNADATAIVFDDANHLFQAAETGAVGEYPTLEPEFTPDFLPALVEWVTAQVGVDD